MPQQQETILYLGRNGAAAAQLQRALACAMRSADGAGRPAHPGFASNGAGHTAPAAAADGVPESVPESDGADFSSPSEATDGGDGSETLPFCLITNQKAALRFVQNTPTQLIAVETNDKPACRRRFCDTLRQRAPSARIVAVCAYPVDYTFAFDAVLALPLRSAEVEQVAKMVCSRAPEPVIRRGTVTLNTVTRQVLSPKGAFDMTPKQCALLTLLMRHANQVVKRADIMRTIWETSYLDDTRTLDVHVRWVRLMIEEDPAQPALLVTQRGVGYKYVAPAES